MKHPVEVQFRHYGQEPVPCINVKIGMQVVGLGDRVAAKFGTDEKTGERAADFAVEMAQEQFWDQIEETVRHYMKDEALTVSQEGRSGGWLAVHGLPPSDEWKTRMAQRWAKLETAARKEIDGYLLQDEQLFEAIEANQWHKRGAEKYNFIEVAKSPKGTKSVCVADLNQYLEQQKEVFIQQVASGFRVSAPN